MTTASEGGGGADAAAAAAAAALEAVIEAGKRDCGKATNQSVTQVLTRYNLSTSYVQENGFDFCKHECMVKELFNNNINRLGLGGLEWEKTYYKYVCPVILLICFCSILFNGILVLVGRRSKSINKSPILLLSLNLAFTDLIVSFLNALNIIFLSYLPNVYDINLFSNCMLVSFELTRIAVMNASALHLLALAVIHYNGTVNPLHYR